MLYLTLFAFTTILFFLAQSSYQRSRPMFYVLSFIAITALSFIAGARDNSIGTDINIYGTLVFKAAATDLSFWKAYDAVSHVSELFYFALNWVCARINDNYGLSLFVQMFVQSSFVFFAMKRYMDRAPLWLTMLIYQLLFYNLTLNLMRQGLAIAFVFWSVRFIEDKRIWPFLLCAFLSFFFHKTGVVAEIILLVVYWAIKRGPRTQKLLLLCSVGAGVLGVYMFYAAIEYISMAVPEFKHFLYYADGSKFKAGLSTMDLLIRLMFLIIVVFFYRNEVVCTSHVNMILFILIADVAALILGIYAYFATRFAYYFIIIEIPYVIMLIGSKKLSAGTRYLVTSAIVMFMIYYCVRFNYVARNNETYPYKSEFLSI